MDQANYYFNTEGNISDSYEIIVPNYDLDGPRALENLSKEEREEAFRLYQSVVDKGTEAYKQAQEEFVRVCTEIARNDLKLK